MFIHTVDRLPSGITVVRVPMPSVASVTALALVNVGSRYETPARWGISHFLEHMVFKGTEHYKDAQTLASAVDAVGARFNAFTSKEYTGYYVKAASSALDLAIDVLSDLLLTPVLRQEDVDREKGVIIEEINMYADMPASHIANVFDQMVYAQESLGHDIIGTKESVSALNSSDFFDHLNEWYGRGNIVLIVSGDDRVVGDEKLLEKITQYFKKGDVEKRQQKDPRQHLGVTPLLPRALRIEWRNTEQAHFVLGFPALHRHDPDRHILSLLSVILGGTMSSRLFSQVREQRGLCYYIHSETEYFHDAGIFGASAGVDPKRVGEAVQVTVDEFRALVDGRKPVTLEELQRAKDNISGKFVLDLEDSESVAQYVGMRQLLQGTIESPDALLQKYQAVELSQIQELAERVLKGQQPSFAIIGPFDDPHMFERAIGL